MPAARTLDWEAIEREYRAGQLSIREIARKYECSDGLIRKRAKSDGWERDLSERVSRAVRNRIMRESMRESLSREAKEATEAEIIEAAAERGRKAVEGHLSRAQRLQAIADRTMQALEAIQRGEDPGWSPFCGKGDCFTSLMRTSADVTDRAVHLERKSLNLDDSSKQADKAFIEMD